MASSRRQKAVFIRQSALNSHREDAISGRQKLVLSVFLSGILRCSTLLTDFDLWHSCACILISAFDRSYIMLTQYSLKSLFRTAKRGRPSDRTATVPGCRTLYSRDTLLVPRSCHPHLLLAPGPTIGPSLYELPVLVISDYCLPCLQTSATLGAHDVRGTELQEVLRPGCSRGHSLLASWEGV